MKIKLIPLLLGLGLTTSLSAATERMCFGQVPIEASTSLVAKITIAENEFFATEKCKRLFSYYEKHVDFTKAECEANKEQLSLDKGYAPFGVFLRGTDSTSKDNIASYDWEIKNIATNEILTTYNAFNAAYVFDEPGEYSAILTITSKDGTTSTDTQNITVWARDGKDYFVNSTIGDDRYNGLAQAPDNNCDANTATIGSCSGPWKTATRAFGEFSPYNVTNFPNGKYTTDGICLESEVSNIVRYNQGNFKIFRDSTFLESEALKDINGNFLPALPTNICKTLVSTRDTILRPGDQVLFNKNQTFEIETGLNTITPYEAINNGVSYHYEALKTSPIANFWHWSKAIGVHFGNYGQGTNPIIKNIGKSSSTLLKMGGVGTLHFSMSDLNFELKSNIQNEIQDRAIFINISGSNPINTIFKGINVKEMHQGILAQTSNDKTQNAQGLFIINSEFYDSKLVQLFTSNSYNDVAILNNIFDYSENHLIYSSISHGLVYKNVLSRPAFGRTAFRLAGGTFDNADHDVWISDNKMSGWVDPRTKATTGSNAFADGSRYNFSLVNLSTNTTKDKAMHDIVFTRNTVLDAENLLIISVAENIHVNHNRFETHDSSRTARLYLSGSMSSRPLNNININNNEFIEHSLFIKSGDHSAGVIQLSNYYQIKCNDQFNHKNINIKSNTFYLPHDQRRVFTFSPLTQGNDLNNSPLPDLTLDQAEMFVKNEITVSQNKIISPNESLPTIQIGGNHTSINPDPSTSSVNWSEFYSGSDFRLYNSVSLLSNNIGINPSWIDISTTSIEQAILASTTASAPPLELTWDDLIAYAQENKITPSQLESMILNQVLAANPSYSGPSANYSDDLNFFESLDHWFTNTFDNLFLDEDNQWNDAKTLATTNKISPNEVMQDIKK